MSRLLLVEDDEALAEALELALEQLGHQVRRVASGEEAIAVDEVPELVLLDVMLPGMDGFEVARRFSASSTPVILLTARADPVDVIVGLECGADDYVVKPAQPRVIDARIKAVLRRSGRPPADRNDARGFGRLVLDEAAMVVTHDGAEVALTPTELRLLVEFAHHPGQAMTRQALLERVWDYGYHGDSRIVDACVQRLRAKVEDDPAHPTLIRTVRGVGYRLVPPG